MKHLLPFLALLFLAFSSKAQLDLSTPLPTDPEVVIDSLPNGLTYYIRHNEKPEGKVELRLVVHAGSLQETDAQQGVAHLTEHMAFNGTTHFEKNDIVSFLQSIGVAFGNDLNAYTAFDRTVYILPIPTDDSNNIQTGFQILQDWAANLTLNNEDIDNERPVILEESRLRKGANEHFIKKIYPELFSGSRYASRMPIGLDSIIKNADYGTIKSFYHQWYRPELMAVVVVGDIEVDKARGLIKKYFSDLKNIDNAPQREFYPVPPYTKDQAMVVTDKEATSYQYMIYYSFSRQDEMETLQDYKERLTRSLFTTMLNQRLDELSRQANPPFVRAGAGFSSIAEDYAPFHASIFAGSDPGTDALKAFEIAMAKVKQYGFLQTELERAKTEFLSDIEQAYSERNKTESGNYVNAYINNFLYDNPIPGIANEYEYYKTLLPNISLEEVNAIASKLKKNEYQFIALTGPVPNDSVSLPASENLLAIHQEVMEMDIKPYEEAMIADQLIDKLPPPGKVTAMVENELLEATEVSLSNGITVTIKQTDFKNDQVLMTAVSRGGITNFKPEDKYNATFLTGAISSMGIGKFSPVDLKKYLAGKTVSVSPYFGQVSHGIRGSSSIKDMETLLQLAYLYLTSPRKDTGLFQSFVQKNKSQTAFLSANPQVSFIDTAFNVYYHYSPLAPVMIPKPAYFDSINLDRMLEMYQQIFGNANGLHFTFVGSMNKDSLITLLEKYLGALPVGQEDFAIEDNLLRPVQGDEDLTVHKGEEPKALTLRIYSAEIPYSESMVLKANAVAEILNIRIIEELREKIKGIYGGGIRISMEKYPYQNYNMILQLPSGPEKVDTLIEAFELLVKDLVENGPSKENLEKVKKQWLENYQVNLKENGTWLSELQDFYFPGEDPHYFINYEELVKALTVEDIHKTAKTLFSTPNVFTAILLPEKE